MKYVIEVVDQDRYLESYDLEFPNAKVYPTGRAEFTEKLSKAMRFDSFREAMDTWKSQSITVPLRPDGKPNRPLTAFTVTIKSVER